MPVKSLFNLKLIVKLAAATLLLNTPWIHFMLHTGRMQQIVVLWYVLDDAATHKAALLLASLAIRCSQHQILRSLPRSHYS
jgi:hypothetical protein